jgi:hypothetical protein
MNRTREVIPPSLDHALMATRVLAALNQLENPRPSPLIAGAMDDAVRFLNNIIKGERYTSELKVAENSYECTLAYGEAIKAVDMLPTAQGKGTRSEHVIELVTECLQAAEALSKKEVVDKQSVANLTSFFGLVREVSLRLDRKPIETVSISE